MRLALNARAGCYNLYCDTREEHVKIKQMMEKPLTATDNMIYADTDSIYAIKTKLNSVYGKVATNMNREYICVSVDKKPTVIFKDKIVAITNNGKRAEIACVSDIVYYTDNNYIDVIKLLV